MVPFLGLGLAISIPPDLCSAQKVTFFGIQFRDPFLGASGGSQGEFWGLFWMVQGFFFLVSDQEFVRHVKKCCPGLFLGEKSPRLILQKHANRTVHLLKIKGALPIV